MQCQGPKGVCTILVCTMLDKVFHKRAIYCIYGHMQIPPFRIVYHGGRIRQGGSGGLAPPNPPFPVGLGWWSLLEVLHTPLL